MRIILTIAVCAWTQIAHAQGPDQQTEPQDPVRDAWSAEYLDLARQVAFTSEASDAEITLNEVPLLKWHNPVRVGETHGDFFVWRRDEIPVAVGTIFSYLIGDGSQRRMAVEFQGLVRERLKFSGPNFSGVLDGEHIGQFEVDLPSQPVADSPNLRLVQTRNVARLCEATTVLRGTKHPLRLLSQPLLSPSESSDAPTALFAYVTGTDPELLLLIQAVANGDELRWQVTPARFTNLYLTVSVRDEVVWDSSDQRLNAAYYDRHGIAEKPADPR